MVGSGAAGERLRIVSLRSKLVGPFDLSVARGECVAVSGASGSGKSLFLRMIADLDPHEGQAWLDGREQSDFKAPEWRRRVAYLSAESGWWGERVAEHYPDPAAARALASRLDLKPELFDGTVLRLSTGEKQRLAMIRILLLRPLVLLLDEPTGALDEESELLTEQVLRECLEGGAAVVIVTHDLAQAARLAKRRFVMEQGHLAPA